MNNLDLDKFEKNQELYLALHPEAEQDLEILRKWERGEMTVTALSLQYHRSKSALYRMRERVASFLSSPMEDPRDPYLQILQSHVMIPQDLYACQLFCSPSPKTFNLFVLSAAIFNAGLPPCIPRWLLAQIYPALGARSRALLAVDALKALTTRFRNKYTFHIYRDVYYDRGICFMFSELTEALLCSNPLPSDNFLFDVDLSEDLFAENSEGTPSNDSPRGNGYDISTR